MIADNEDQECQPAPSRHSCVSSLVFWLAILRTLELILGFVSLCLAGYVTFVFGGDYAHTFALTFFTFIWTLFFMVYIAITPLWLPKLYNYWAHVVLETMTLIFWVASFSLFIWECQYWDGAQDALQGVLSEELIAAINSLPNEQNGIRALRAATGLACINWIMFGASLVISVR